MHIFVGHFAVIDSSFSFLRTFVLDSIKRMYNYRFLLLLIHVKLDIQQYESVLYLHCVQEQ